MIFLIIIDIIFIVFVYLKYYKFQPNIEDSIEQIKNKDAILIGYINDLNFSNSFDLVKAEIIELNIKNYIKINYSKENNKKYEYTIILNADMTSDKINKYEMFILNFLFTNKMEITKEELEEKIKNIYNLYTVQFEEIEKILKEKIAEENIIDLKKQKKLKKEGKICTRISAILIFAISILNAIGIFDIFRLYLIIYIIEKIFLCILILKANCYTNKGKAIKYNIEKYKNELQDKEFFKDNVSMQEIVLNKEFANSIALHINTQAKNVFIDDKIAEKSNKILKITIIKLLAILVMFLLSVIIITNIVIVLPISANAWIFIIIAISIACVADITVSLKNNKK